MSNNCVTFECSRLSLNLFPSCYTELHVLPPGGSRGQPCRFTHYSEPWAAECTWALAKIKTKLKIDTWFIAHPITPKEVSASRGGRSGRSEPRNYSYIGHLSKPQKSCHCVNGATLIPIHSNARCVSHSYLLRRESTGSFCFVQSHRHQPTECSWRCARVAWDCSESLSLVELNLPL